MENSQHIILSEIREMISSVHRQIHQLENRLGELEALEVKTKVEEQPAMEPEEPKQHDEEPNQHDEVLNQQDEVPNEEEEKEKRPAVLDVMTAREPWRTDRPGPEVNDIRSAISLNDRLLFINFLFDEDSSLFSDTVDRFNSMGSLDEVVSYMSEHFQKWDMQSEVVYRFIMAVRRKLR